MGLLLERLLAVEILGLMERTLVTHLFGLGEAREAPMAEAMLRGGLAALFLVLLVEETVEMAAPLTEVYILAPAGLEDTHHLAEMVVTATTLGLAAQAAAVAAG